MLIECPECKLQVSNKAMSCPHCGYPLKSSTRPSQTSIKKRIRLPNGFGQITKINKKNLRNPYRVMITVGKTECGKPICKLIKPKAYFESYNDAYKALVEYNRNPYDFCKDLTIDELHTIWLNSQAMTKLSSSTIKVYDAAWKHCDVLKNIMLSEFRIRTLKIHLDSIKNDSMKRMVKIIFSKMFEYAVQYEYIERNIIKDISLEADLSVKKNHIIFTNEEMDILWGNLNLQYVDWIIIQCYTGMRPQELCNIRIQDINLDEKIIYGGIKTKAGKNRAIPIHEKILPIVKRNIDKSKEYNSEWLLTTENRKHLSYNNYLYRFNNVIKILKLNPEHRLHDPRKQFITMAKKYNVDEYAIKRIVGHKIDDITENVYTERDLNWLVFEVNKIV